MTPTEATKLARAKLKAAGLAHGRVTARYDEQWIMLIVVGGGDIVMRYLGTLFNTRKGHCNSRTGDVMIVFKADLPID
jgi:hypothetical protein